MKTYQKAFDFSSNYLGANNQVTKNLRNVLDTAKTTIEKKITKNKKEDPQAKQAKKVNMNKTAKKEFLIKNSALVEKKASGPVPRKREVSPPRNKKESKPQIAPQRVKSGNSKNKTHTKQADFAVESHGTDSNQEMNHVNKSSSEQPLNDSNANISKSKFHDRGSEKESKKEDRGPMGWDRMISNRGDDSDKGDPDDDESRE